jgi:hypothetical protein
VLRYDRNRLSPATFVAVAPVYGGQEDRNDAIPAASVAVATPNGCTAAVPLAPGGTCTFTETFNTFDNTPDNADYGEWLLQVQVTYYQRGTRLQNTDNARLW